MKGERWENGTGRRSSGIDMHVGTFGNIWNAVDRTVPMQVPRLSVSFSLRALACFIGQALKQGMRGCCKRSVGSKALCFEFVRCRPAWAQIGPGLSEMHLQYFAAALLARAYACSKRCVDTKRVEKPNVMHRRGRAGSLESGHVDVDAVFREAEALGARVNGCNDWISR